MIRVVRLPRAIVFHGIYEFYSECFSEELSWDDDEDDDDDN